MGTNKKPIATRGDHVLISSWRPVRRMRVWEAGKAASCAALRTARLICKVSTKRRYLSDYYSRVRRAGRVRLVARLVVSVVASAIAISTARTADFSFVDPSSGVAFDSARHKVAFDTDLVPSLCTLRVAADQRTEFLVQEAVLLWEKFGSTGYRIGKSGFELGDAKAFPSPPAPTDTIGRSLIRSIAGFWAAVPEGRSFLDGQNKIWSTDPGSPWHEHWSAAFTSWLMCKLGLTEDEFKRSALHWVYLAHAWNAPFSAFAVEDAHTAGLERGDLLCAHEPREDDTALFRSLQDWIHDPRSPLHCYVVVDVGDEIGRVIGGNVLGPQTRHAQYGTVAQITVGLTRTQEGRRVAEWSGDRPGGKAWFAVLKRKQ
jgi:hypothetical protein